MNPDESENRNSLSPRMKQLLVGAAGVAALLLGAVLIYSVLVTPQKQPYRDALSQYKQVYAANVTFMNSATALNGATSTKEQTQKAVEATDAALTRLVAANKALGEAEVLADGEGKDAYTAFSEKLDKYVAYNKSMLESRQQVRPVLTSVDCTNALASTGGYAAKVTPMKNCATSMKALEKVSDADYNALVTAYNSNFAKLVTLYETAAADAANEETYLKQHEAILDEITQANTTFADGLKTSQSSVDITATAQALDAYLSKKSRVF